jgi:hypothetical protein
MTSSMADVFQDMRATIEDASARLRLITEADSEKRLAIGKWSAKEILGHLIDSAANNHVRFVTAQLKDDLNFSGYDQEAWVRTQHYQQSTWSSLVNLWASYNYFLANTTVDCSAILIPPKKVFTLA